MMGKLIAAAYLLLLTGCFENASDGAPPPVAMTSTALGYYCQMTLAEHPGPKAQIHLVGQENPIFFSQVRDAIAYQRMPEQSNRIIAVYVNDMGAAPSWEEPGIDNWIAASSALFVAGSRTIGGMGAPELVPFSERAAAEAFASREGGRIVTLPEISDEDVLGPVDPMAESEDEPHYNERLQTLSEGKGS